MKVFYVIGNTSFKSLVFIVMYDHIHNLILIFILITNRVILRQRFLEKLDNETLKFFTFCRVSASFTHRIFHNMVILS